MTGPDTRPRPDPWECCKAVLLGALLLMGCTNHADKSASWHGSKKGEYDADTLLRVLHCKSRAKVKHTRAEALAMYVKEVNKKY